MPVGPDQAASTFAATKMVKQNDTLIEQNKEIISRLDEIKNK
ncbi:hypothetical protein ACQCVP_17655 [Rossellomorea vietnamensis]